MSHEGATGQSNKSLPQKWHVSVLILCSTKVIASQAEICGASLHPFSNAVILMWVKLAGAVVTLAKISDVMVPAFWKSFMDGGEIRSSYTHVKNYKQIPRHESLRVEVPLSRENPPVR